MSYIDLGSKEANEALDRALEEQARAKSMYQTSEQGMEEIRYEELRKKSVEELEALAMRKPRDELAERVLREACSNVLGRTILSNE